MKVKDTALLQLHILLMIYSVSGICGKIASLQPHINFKFILCYGIIICLLGVYAIGWQQIIKKIPLTMAYSNKSVTVVWGLLWGALLFDEIITLKKVFGCLIIIVGVCLFTKSDIGEQRNG